jgi:hypothetical protein
MSKTHSAWRSIGATATLLITSAFASAQELPSSGVTGYDFFYATSPAGASRLYGVNVHRWAVPIKFGLQVNAVPSRWAHRRRTLGALETEIASPMRGVFLTPMGDAPGNGKIHLVDLRSGTHSVLMSTGNPASYDLALVKSLQYVFCAEDDGAGHTLLRGFSYATPGTLMPLSPATLTLPGSPAAYVNRIGVDEDTFELHVATAAGIQVAFVSAFAPQMSLGPFHSTAPAAPTTNPTRFDLAGQATWIIGTSTFTSGGAVEPLEAGYCAWTANSILGSGSFGSVPTAPGKRWVPAVGDEELAVVGNGSSAYVYYLLREPPPGTFYIKPSAIGVVRFSGLTAPVHSTLPMPDDVGEPFAIPTVSGTRVAFESSYGPPFNFNPPDGGEKISIVYTPLDPLGASTPFGSLGVPAPLGGRISTKGMDRPIWSPDGLRVMAATSHFPGAPNPGVPGLEVLDVPAGVALTAFVGPHTVTPNMPFPNQSIVFPGAFRPRDPTAASAFNGLFFYGNVFNGGLASLAATTYGEIGQMQFDPLGFTQSTSIPDFPAILEPTFNDVFGSTTPIPGNFGARRTSFNFAPRDGIDGLTMIAAIDSEILVQMTGIDMQAELGLATPLDPIRLALPAGWITTTEFNSF